MLRCLTIRCVVARHTDNGDARYSSVCQLSQHRRNTIRLDRPLQLRLLPESDRITAAGQRASKAKDPRSLTHLILLANMAHKCLLPRPGWRGSRPHRAASRDKSCAPVWPSTCWACDREPRCPYATSRCACGDSRHARHPAAASRVTYDCPRTDVEVKLVDGAHQLQFIFAERLRLVVHAAAADLEQPGLLLNRQLVSGIDHLFALKRPAFESALSKKSRSRLNSPILACSLVASTLADSCSLASPKTPSAPSRSWLFHCVIWFACTSNCWANSERVFSPFLGGHLKTGHTWSLQNRPTGLA